MTGDVIKSFLVGLGFGVDDASLAKFNKAIASATLRVTALYASIKVAAAGIVYGLSKISEGFEQMGYEYRIIAPAINKALVLRRELLKAYAAAGINITKVVQASVKLNMSLAKTRFAFEAIYKSVGSRFFGLLTKQSDLFRQKIYANMPKIQNALERFVKFIFKAVEATTTLGLRLWSILGRVYDFFVTLDKATDGWSTRIIAVIAAWKLLNLSFLATPLGMLLTGFIALLALWDDFKTFQEGGESLFNWSGFLPVIQEATKYFQSLLDVLGQLFQTVLGIVDAFYHLFTGDFTGFLDRMQLAVESLVNALKGLWETIKGAGSFGSSLLNFAKGMMDNPNTGANLNRGTGGIAPVTPIGPGAQNSQTNLHVQQQTDIKVMSSADAGAVGKAVSGEQGKVNFDMVRNMKGAVR